HALALGLRGLPGDSSLAELLAAERGAPAPDMGPRALADKIWAWEQEAFAVKPRRRKPPGGQPKVPRITIEQVLAWADAHHAATGCWPVKISGKVTTGSDETWARIDNALRKGIRGLAVITSLPRLLNEKRGVPTAGNPAPLTLER